MNSVTQTKEIVAVVENHLGYKMENIDLVIKKIMAKSFLKPIEDLKDDALLVEDLDVDSLGVFEMVINFEDEFGVEVQDREMLKFKTVKDAVEGLKSFLEKTA